jgi:hypothetical protein
MPTKRHRMYSLVMTQMGYGFELDEEKTVGATEYSEGSS